MKIMVVEDAVGIPIIKVLKASGHDTILAKDGKEAWGIINKIPFDFLIVDWMLPELSGIDLVKKIRQHEQYSRLPILMISGRSEKEDILTAIQAGVDNYIAKPFTPVQLMEKIDDLLEACAAQEKQSVDQQEQVQRVVQGLGAFRRDSEQPFILFGEQVKTVKELLHPSKKNLADYLGGAVEAIKKKNDQVPELNLAYTIETNTSDIIKHIKSRITRERVRLVLVSTECSGNSFLMVRLININKSNHFSVCLVCDNLGDVPLLYRNELNALNVKIYERKSLNAALWDRLLDQHTGRQEEQRPDIKTLSPTEIRQYILRDLESMETLPILPAVYQKITTLAEDPDSDVKEWAGAIKVDPMSCAVVFRLAHSSEYGFQGKINDIERAIVLLGKKKVHDLVCGEAVQRSFSSFAVSGFSIKDFWHHNVAVGFAAYILSFPLDDKVWKPEQRQRFDSLGFGAAEIKLLRSVDLPRHLKLNHECQEPFLGGLLHDIGKAVIAQAYPELYSLLIEALEANSWSIPMCTAERELAGGLTHPAVGEILGKKWGLDTELCRVIGQHHQPETSDSFSFLINLADFVGQVAFPFPQDAQFPLSKALSESALEQVEAFLPEGFFDQPLLRPDEFCRLATAILPAVKRLTSERQAVIG